MITISCRRILKVHEIHQLFATARTRAGWLKPALPVEPKYQTPSLLMEGPCWATPAKPASLVTVLKIEKNWLYETEFFSCADLYS